MDFRRAISSLEEEITQLQQARVYLVEAEASENQRLLLEQELAQRKDGSTRRSKEARAKMAAAQQRRRERERVGVSAEAAAPQSLMPIPPVEIPARPARKTMSTSPLAGPFPIRPVVVPPRPLHSVGTPIHSTTRRNDIAAPSSEASLDALMRDFGLRPRLHAHASSEA